MLALFLQCLRRRRRLFVVCTECIVAKRCVLELKLLLTAWGQEVQKSITKMNDLDLCLEVILGHVNHCLTITFAIEFGHR